MIRLATGLSLLLVVGLIGTLGYLTYFGNVGILLPTTQTVTMIAAPVATTTVAPPTPPTAVAKPNMIDGKIDLPQQVRVTGISVSISAGANMGSGVVVSNNIVLTVNHVINDQAIALVDIGRFVHNWVPARVIGKLKASGEDIVVLQLTGNNVFDNSSHFTIGTGFRLPRYIVTPRGVYDFNPGSIVPGDSGGAILNIHGELIGLVSGYLVDGRINIITMFR